MKITIPALGSTGVIKDLPPHELGISALTSVSNIRFKNGAAERISGDRALFTAPSVTPYSLQIYRTAADLFLVHAGLAKVFVDAVGGRTEITGSAPTGAAGDRWTGGVFNGVLILNNGIDLPQFWGGLIANDLAALTNWDTAERCKVMRPFKNYLVALDITKTSTRYPHMVKWSSAADPGTIPASWDEANPANDAGEVDLAETTDRMVDALPLGDSLIIYKSSSMYAMSYIGGQYIFQFRRLPGESGMLARGCACLVPGGHVVLTAGDVVLNNGAQATSIVTDKMRRWLFESMDKTYYERSFVVSNPQNNEVWVCFPETGSETCTKALIWSWADNTLSIRDLDGVTCGVSGPFENVVSEPWNTDSDAWSTDSSPWSTVDMPFSQAALILGTNAPLLINCDTTVTFNGATFGASIERTGIALDSPDQLKLLRSIVPRIEGTTGSTVYLQTGSSLDVEGPYAWSDAVTYVIGTTRKADSFASGRFLAFRIYSTAAFAWKIRSIDLDVVPQGAY